MSEPLSDLNEELCKYFHEQYESHAEILGWYSQTPFAWKDVPLTNKMVMRNTVHDLMHEYDIRKKENKPESQIPVVVIESKNWCCLNCLNKWACPKSCQLTACKMSENCQPECPGPYVYVVNLRGVS